MSWRASVDEFDRRRALVARSGAIDGIADREADASERARRFLSCRPSSVQAPSGRLPCDDPVDRRDRASIDIVPIDRREVHGAPSGVRFRP